MLYELNELMQVLYKEQVHSKKLLTDTCIIISLW